MRYTAEVVTWVDSSGGGNWQPLIEAVKDEVCTITSIGYVINESDTQLQLAQSIDAKTGMPGRLKMVDNTIVIPKVAITARQKTRYYVDASLD